MNARCYRCGWSFSLSREAIEEAAVSGRGQTAHVIHCPRCRQAIRVPMDQILRALPPGWAPGAISEPASAALQEGATPSALEVAAGAELVSEPAEPAADPQKRSERRHRRSSKTHSGDSAAVPAAKKSTHPN